MVSERALAALGENRNNWTMELGHASAVIAAAVADGRIPEELIAAYPADHSYPALESERLADLAGFRDWSGYGEDIGIGVEAIRALTVGDVGIEEGTWYFHDLAELHGLSLEQMRAECSGHTIREAAALIVAADAYFSAHIATYGTPPSSTPPSSTPPSSTETHS